MTASGQCRLSAVIACTHDSSKIVDVLGKMFRTLHRHLSWDTLAGHRQRFKEIYEELRKIYLKLSTIQYLRGILQVKTELSEINPETQTLSLYLVNS